MKRTNFIIVYNSHREKLSGVIPIGKEFDFVIPMNDIPGDLRIQVPVKSETYNVADQYTVGNIIELYAKSDFSEPYIIYKGEIVEALLDYRTGNVSLTVRHSSYRLKKIVASADSDTVYEQTDESIYNSNYQTKTIFKITTDSGATFINGIYAEVGLYHASFASLKVYLSLSDAENATNSIGTIAENVSLSNKSSFSIVGDSVAVSASTDYYLRIEHDAQGATPGFSGVWGTVRGESGTSAYSYYFGSGWNAVAIIPAIRVYYTNSTTEFEVNGENVRDRIESTLKQYNEQSSSALVYSNSTLAYVDETTTYTHTNSSLYQVISKTIESGGNDSIYWYIDPATDVFWLLKTSEEYTKYLNIAGVTEFEYASDISNQTNRVYFVGKDEGSGNLYIEYNDTGSQDNYGVKAETVVDKRVTSTVTAQSMANYIFDSRSTPVEIIKLTLLDNAHQDIDSIEVYDMISLVNIQGAGRVYLDIDELDDIYTDADPLKIFDRIMRVSSIRHKGQEVTLTLNQYSRMNVSARQQEQISSLALENNPTTPS